MTQALKSKRPLCKDHKKEDGNSWVLEGIVGYLQSPAWIVPVIDFFDDYCECFESKEENKLEYTEIHFQYKSLVEKLLASYMAELQISEELFSQACNHDTSTISCIEEVFGYIWAADDFLLFKRLMCKHNLELEMQAINLVHMQEHTNLENDPSQSTDNLRNEEKAQMLKTQLEEREADDLRMALERSKDELERLNAQAQEEKRMLEEAIQLSLNWPSIAGEEKSKADIPPTNHKGNDVKPEPNKNFNKAIAATGQSLTSLRKISNAEAASNWIAKAQLENASTTVAQPTNAYSGRTPSKPDDIKSVDLTKRKYYLKSQKEKLIEMKKTKRKEELKIYQGNSNTACTSNDQQVENLNKGHSDSSGENIMKARRSLAERLKREVIQQKR